MIKKIISKVGIFMMSICCLTACNFQINNQTQDVSSSSTQDSSSNLQSSSNDESSSVSNRTPNIIMKNPGGRIDFIVEIESGRDPIVLQLTDTQIIDAAQARPGRTGVDTSFWATDKVEERCYNYLTEIIEATDPDLIILTGDIVYGEFDDSGTSLLSFVEFMESFKIAWAPVLGNHES